MDNDQTKKIKPVLSTNLFLVVGIGASAGGLDAFKQFIKAIPVDSGMAFILVQHLDPHHDSILCELLQKVTLIPISEVTDHIEVEPDHIYVIPPNKLLNANDGVLNLTDRPTATFNNLPIDLFFKSLAEVHQSQAIGVVLSGTGKDGTLGLKAIKQQGGITFAQDHSSATFNEMPLNAVNANVVDFEMEPSAMVLQLLELSKRFSETTIEEKVKEATPDDLCFKEILTILDLQKGVDFLYYKQTTIRRRITRRMVLKNLARMQDYLAYLKVTPGEVDILFQDILIPVTEFFRDPRTFDHLVKICFPAILKIKKVNEAFRVWCVGCSTGQEAYSIAICLYEFLVLQGEPFKIQIFATDISDQAIAHARSAFYTKTETANISPERLEKFFVKTEGGYHVSKSIRDSCVFATHNVLTNPPFAGIDLITCRNVLIYMDPFLQRKAMATFHYSLNEKAMLFLGRSESVGSSSDLFSPFSDVDKIYSRNSVPGRFIHITAKRRVEFLEKGDLKLLNNGRSHDDFQRSADEVLLARAPAGVIVNDQFEILHFRGKTSDWLESPPGKPSVNILKMANHELAVDLRNGLFKAKKSREPFIKEGIVLHKHGVKKIVTLEVIPLLNTINPYFLILFRNTHELLITTESEKVSGNGREKRQEVRAKRLEEELSQTREDMRTITEDQEAGNEELLSANEELLSGSEELRSLNEELEISKEELQSTVEELSVANQELAFRNDELNYSRKYAEAIVTTISEALIVLDKELKIKSANTAFYKNFNSNEKETQGLFFYEIDDGQWDIAELRTLLNRTLSENNFKMRFELKRNFKKAGDRAILLHAQKVANDATSEPLILLALEDVTDQRALETELLLKANYSKLVLDSSPTITSTASADGNITYSNKFFLNYSGLSLKQSIADGWYAVVHPDQVKSVTNAWLESVASGKDFQREVFLKRHDGAYRWHIAHALPIRNTDGTITSWVCSASDIHDQKMFADELEKQIRERTQLLQEANTQLEHSNKNLEQFAFIASHDLQEPLRKIKTFANILSENYLEKLPSKDKTLVDKIHKSSDRMSALIQDVLNFSRIEHTENLFVKTDVNDILNNVISDFALLIEEKKAIIKVEPLPVIEAIPLQMNQLFYNLLSNSLKFCHVENQPIITISSRKLSLVEVMKYRKLNPALSYFEIFFADNGIGFDEMFKEKIFQIFQRLHPNDQYTGTGIGLALCKKIVLNHNGLIFAESQENAGALFHIILPLNEHHTEFELLPGYVE